MKKLYSLIIASALTFSASAVNIPVSVANFSFTPQTFTAVVGDVIVFTLASGSHNVTTISGALPAGAAPLASGPMTTVGQVYSYTITVAGNYGYNCTNHPSTMIAGFQASATGIADPTVNLITNVYPSPFTDKVTVKYNGIESIEFINIVGEKVKDAKIETVEGKLEIDLSPLPSGIYFYRTYKDGIVVETRKIVKAR